ncbi:MAG TPA: zinc metallopeptidase [Verrucomicrobiota bacterium]|nr:zinc metallopeptidase [Verrucomicrobiota bacterium]HRZ38436.1 zinc metallopeptidase [Candidatus Paceibacterota bacterium]HRZ58215.1 zinc metallopeptidase [Candidatus Paceibacterota bacterium]
MAAKTVTVLIQMRTHFFWFVLAGLLLALWAQWRLRSAYRRWSTRAIAARPLTGAGAAREILDAAGLIDVPIKRTRGHLTDHYDPQKRALRLSDEVHDMDSLAAVGIAAHEAGHALQHQELGWPMQARLGLLPLTRIGTWLALPLLAAGLVLRVPPLMVIGAGLFLVLLTFQLVTLPLEFDASRRAGRVLRDRGMMTTKELAGVGEVLSAAAWTYVAAFTLTFAQRLRLLRWGRLSRPPF